MFYQVSIIIGIFIIATSDVVRSITAGANILAFFPLPIYSHFSGFNPLFLELANRGHRVTVVSPFYPKGDVPNTYQHVPIPNIKIQRIKNQNLVDIRHSYRVSNMINVQRSMMKTVKRTLMLNETRTFLNNTRNSFDVVLVECWYSDIYLALGHRYSAPTVCLSPMTPPVTLSQSLGIPDHPAYVPSFWLRYSDFMSFSERLYNAAIAVAELIVSKVVFHYENQKMLVDLYTYPGHQNCPPLDELRRTVQLTLVNGHYSVSYPRPYPPNVVQVAGMHMRSKTSTSVDKKFKALLDGAIHGVIYFSFGSNLKMSDLAEREVQVFVESFRKLKQIVLWKWENGTIANLPDNVYINKWFPQQYILSHKNCKLFITHGGYHSLVEALHIGLPLIGFPFYTDQYYNMRFVIENGFGIEISLDHLNLKVFDNALGNILNNISYKNNAQRASNIFLDLQVSAMDTAVYSVEYLIRNGVNHTSPVSTSLSWYQYFVVDIVVFISVIIALTTLVLYKSIKYLKNIINLKDKKLK